MHGYAVIIFIHHTFAIFMSVLSKFVIFSSAVHQLIVTIGISTASLGVCLVLIGSFMLAGLASYLHMPVIGRYLAVIGVFCLYAGLTISTGQVVKVFAFMLQTPTTSYCAPQGSWVEPRCCWFLKTSRTLLHYQLPS
ncbi:hypothetical protein DVH05_024790 [Phytophthora capsici]|nr:hypothetical protein DVH05_008434 [Phytophthora capsici]KAG1699793.1 hypothetical protein DVH05_012686 [Phytophthora capsici]KAG1708106.1 hypothetical protein DVH05_024790 [Phytophthora capsici]